MRTIHHVGISRHCSSMADEIRQLNLELTNYLSDSTTGPWYFEIAEDDTRWTYIQPLLSQSAREQMWSRESYMFSLEELNHASALSIVDCWTNGYPEPSDAKAVPGKNYLSYFPSVYDLAEYCSKCLTGAQQKAPFRIKKDPPWGRRSFMQLNWILDELFVTPAIFHSVFEPFGISCRPVLLEKSSRVSDSICQLEISSVCNVEVENVPFTVCDHCRRRKYNVGYRGLFPVPSCHGPAICKSDQFFGGVQSAFKTILINDSLYRRTVADQLRGISFQPCLVRRPPVMPHEESRRDC